MCSRNPELCTCPCHHDQGVKHASPCCAPCPVCFLSFVGGGPSRKHVAACAAEKRAELVRSLENTRVDAVCRLISHPSERLVLHRLLGGVMEEIETLIRSLTSDPEIQEWVITRIAEEAGAERP